MLTRRPIKGRVDAARERRALLSKERLGGRTAYAARDAAALDEQVTQKTVVSPETHQELQTQSTGLRHPSSNHCHSWLRHMSRKTVS